MKEIKKFENPPIDDAFMVHVCVYVYHPTNSYGHMETGSQLKVSFDRQEKPGIKLRPLVYTASGLSNTPQWFFLWFLQGYSKIAKMRHHIKVSH